MVTGPADRCRNQMPELLKHCSNFLLYPLCWCSSASGTAIVSGMRVSLTPMADSEVSLLMINQAIIPQDEYFVLKLSHRYGP